MSLTTSLAEVWELQEASGTALAKLNSSNNLTDNNGVGTATGPAGGVNITNARSFVRPSGQYLSHAASPTFSLSSAFTIALWAYPNNTAASSILVTQNQGFGTEDFTYYTDILGRPCARIYNTNYGVGTSTNSSQLSTGTWYFLVATYDSTTISVSVNNGTGQTYTFAVSGPARTGGKFGIGYDSDIAAMLSLNYMDGRIAQVALWTRVLTGTELTSLYNSGNGLAYANWAAAGGGTAPRMIAGGEHLGLLLWEAAGLC